MSGFEIHTQMIPGRASPSLESPILHTEPPLSLPSLSSPSFQSICIFNRGEIGLAISRASERENERRVRLAARAAMPPLSNAKRVLKLWRGEERREGKRNLYIYWFFTVAPNGSLGASNGGCVAIVPFGKLASAQAASLLPEMVVEFSRRRRNNRDRTPPLHQYSHLLINRQSCLSPFPSPSVSKVQNTSLSSSPSDEGSR